MRESGVLFGSRAAYFGARRLDGNDEKLKCNVENVLESYEIGDFGDKCECWVPRSINSGS